MPISSIESGSLSKVWEVKTLGKSRDQEASSLLEAIAKQVQPIMMKRGWRIKRLSEFCPRNPSLLGLNIGGGAEIKIRLRPFQKESEFYPYEDLLGTMLHELSHNEHGPHNAAFYKLLDEITKECEELMAKGITGTGQGFDTMGRRLGGFSSNPPLSLLRQKALAAAERRANVANLLPCGPKRLGGDREIMGLLTPAQASAMAAERRLKDDIWCAAPDTCATNHNEHQHIEENHAHSSSSSTGRSTVYIDVDEDSEKDNNIQMHAFSGSVLGSVPGTRVDECGWMCATCTLSNRPLALVCEACNSQRPTEKHQGWHCKFCTLQNSSVDNKCSACGEWRYSYGPSVSSLSTPYS